MQALNFACNITYVVIFTSIKLCLNIKHCCPTKYICDWNMLKPMAQVKISFYHEALYACTVHSAYPALSFSSSPVAGFPSVALEGSPRCRRSPEVEYFYMSTKSLDEAVRIQDPYVSTQFL